jgi:hypothetical protein
MAKARSPDGEYQAALGALRRALLTAEALSGAERQVGLLMLEHVNRRDFIERGVLECWVGLETLAQLAGISRSTVKKARARLRRIGAIAVAREGGFGPRDTARYGFDRSWADRAIAEVRRRAPRAQRLLAPDRATPPAADPSPAARVERRPPKGGQASPPRVDARSPEPLEENLLSEPLEAEARPRAPTESGACSSSQTRALKARGCEDEPALDWHQALARMQRQVGALEEERLTSILMFATAAEGQELSASGTPSARLREIFGACARRCHPGALPSGPIESARG